MINVDVTSNDNINFWRKRVSTKYTTNRPHIHSSRVMGSSQKNFRCSIPQCQYLKQSSTQTLSSWHCRGVRCQAEEKKCNDMNYLMSILLNWKSKCSSKAKISYFKCHCLSVHQQIVRLKVPELNAARLWISWVQGETTLQEGLEWVKFTCATHHARGRRQHPCRVGTSSSALKIPMMRLR